MLPSILSVSLDLLLDLLWITMSMLFSSSTLFILVKECGFFLFAAAQLTEFDFLQFASIALYLLLVCRIVSFASGSGSDS